MRLVLFLLQSSERSVIWAVIAGALSGACGAALIGVMNSSLAAGTDWDPTLPISFAVLWLLAPLSRFLSDRLLIRLAQRSVFEMRLRMARRILATPLRQLESIGSHRLLVALTDDSSSIALALAEVPTLLVNTTIVIGCFIYMGWLSPYLLVMSLVLLGIGAATSRLALTAGIRRFRKAREIQDQLFGHFRGMMEGTKELKLHQKRRKSFLGLLESTAWEMRRLLYTARILYSVAANWGTSLFFLIVGLLIFVMPRLQPLSLSVLTGFALILLFLRGPIQITMALLPQLGQASVALDKVERLGLSLQATEPLDAVVSIPTWKSLELRGVQHAYEREGEDTSFTLGPITTSFHPGELVFLVGGNGSGKTTFAKLLTGLYAPEGGDILLNGEPVTDEAREAYRQHFACVFSEFYLFDRLLGLETPELDQEARFYLKQLRLDHKVEIRDGALSTTDLSRGQRKRLALLTAYLEDRPLYVFDEWAADQDPPFKEFFYEELLAELKARGKSVLVISHDDRYFHVADRILKLEDGQLVDEQVVEHPLQRAEAVEALA
jgi:putative ATP-binding cassette transporter